MENELILPFFFPSVQFLYKITRLYKILTVCDCKVVHLCLLYLLCVIYLFLFLDCCRHHDDCLCSRCCTKHACIDFPVWMHFYNVILGCCFWQQLHCLCWTPICHTHFHLHCFLLVWYCQNYLLIHIVDIVLHDNTQKKIYLYLFQLVDNLLLVLFKFLA